MSVMPVKPDEPLAVTLTAAEWNSVLMVLDEAPLPRRVVNPLFLRIQQQCMTAMGEVETT